MRNGKAALALIESRADRPGRITLGADKGYNAEDFVNELRSMNVTPHVAAKVTGSAIDGRTTRHKGYAVSQRIRKRIEEVFGWGKTVGPIAQTMLRGIERVGAQFTFTVASSSRAKGKKTFYWRLFFSGLLELIRPNREVQWTCARAGEFQSLMAWRASSTLIALSSSSRTCLRQIRADRMKSTTTPGSW